MLVQPWQDFCFSLEQLIIWLYSVVERMERLTPPTVEIESVKSSLADYQVSPMTPQPYKGLLFCSVSPLCSLEVSRYRT